MAPLGHFLSGLACRYYSRRPGRAGLGTTPRAARSGELRRRHLERCVPCQARLRRERQYLERLRGAAVPAASDDLTARLLARTGALAAGRGDGSAPERPARAPRAPEGHQGPGPWTTPHAGRPWRLAAGFAGGAAASVALVGGAAFLLGGAGPGQAPAGPFTAALPSAALGQGAPTSGNVSQAAWKLSGEPDVAPPGALDADQLAALCGHGWTCPQLRELGYHLVWARGAVAGGAEVLELHLTDGTHSATVLEQRPTDGAGRGSAAPPVNVLTGHRASEDGFVPAGADGAPAGTATEGARSPALWVNTHAPFQAIYSTQTATYTYISELPAEQADDGVAALVSARPVAAGAPERGSGLAARLGRGLERIMELLAR